MPAEVILRLDREYIDGMTHLTLSVAVQIPYDQSHSQLESKFKDSWTTLRYKMPCVACKSSCADDKERHNLLRYAIPRTGKDLEDWVQDTLFFSDSDATLEETHLQLKDRRWWTQPEDKYVTELHISPLKHTNEWHFR